MSEPISSEATASARCQPVTAMTHRGSEHGQRAERVVDHFQERRPAVQVLPLPAGEQQERDRVAGQPDQADDEHHSRRHRLGPDQTAYGPDQDEPAHRQQHGGLRGPPAPRLHKSQSHGPNRKSCGSPHIHASADRTVIGMCG